MKTAVSILITSLVLTTLALFIGAPVGAAESAGGADPGTDVGRMTPATLAGLELRPIGPALTSGRISDFAVDPRNRKRYYVAVASGGVWKTDNAGTTWTPVFDDEGSYSIGVVTLDPNDPLVVWVGTGENNSQRSVGYGDGVYKSVDGGKQLDDTWASKDSEHIGNIVVDPRNSDRVFVAAHGPLWRSGGDRGLFLTDDGGKSWNNVLEISENTGVNEVVMDPRNPDVMYAAAYQRRRHVWTLINGGPESGALQDQDGGKTWTEAGERSAQGGHRADRAGGRHRPSRTRSTPSSRRPARSGGFYRSMDAGASWDEAQRLRRRQPPVLQRDHRRSGRCRPGLLAWTPGCRSPRTAARASARSVRSPSMWTTTPCGSIRRTPTTCWPGATAASTRPSTGARPGCSRPTCR